MKKEDLATFTRVINGMAAMKKFALTPESLDLWWACMADWPIEDFKAAAVHVLKNSTFMPTPKDFEDLRKAGQQTAGEVFADIRKWLKYGAYGYTLREDTPRPIAAAIRAMGGADAYAMCDVDKLPFLEKRFCQHYEQISGAEDTREGLPQIAYREEGAQLQRDTADVFRRIGK